MMPFIAGALVSLGVFFIAYGLKSPKPSLARQLMEVQQAEPALLESIQYDNLSLRVKMGRYLGLKRGRKIVGDELFNDLNVLGIDVGPYVATKIWWSLIALITSGPLLSLFFAFMEVSWVVSLWMAVVVAILTFIFPDRRIRSRAKRERDGFMSSVSSYLNLVALRSAASSGHNEALVRSAQVGDGPGWRRIRSHITSARLAGKSEPHGVGALGKEMDIPELRSLSAQLILAEKTGAKTVDTLRAKAGAIRAKERSTILGEAGVKKSSMVFSSLCLVIGFLIIILYPVIVQLTSL